MLSDSAENAHCIRVKEDFFQGRPQPSYFSAPPMGTTSASPYCRLPWLSQPQLRPAVPPPGLRLTPETTNGLLLPLVVYEPSWEEAPTPEPPAWFHRFLQMHMPPWFQMPAHASSLEFISKGQFPKARAGEVGEILCYCDSGRGDMCSVHTVVGRAELSLTCVFPCLGRGTLFEICVPRLSSPSLSRLALVVVLTHHRQVAPGIMNEVMLHSQNPTLL